MAIKRSNKSSRRHFAKRLAIIADPVFDPNDARIGGRRSDVIEEPVESVAGTELQRLSYSRKEAKTLASLMEPRREVVALDFAANRETLADSQVRQSQIVHIATHGLVDSNRPEMSGLIFSRFSADRHQKAGFWGLQDIFTSRFGAELVVLSGCQTALGENIEGEGLLGLAWAFLHAGANTVVASLWDVDEPSTAELMRFFYEGIIRDKLPPAAALGAAQQRIAADVKWKHPFYWAGFVVLGDWKPLSKDASELR